ncbi:GHKL domain-containing protein [Candidatus Enterococcus courvalinii]|uniref:GHKL domain-containing protein n=1 Tax=Candidatus Enterococcus courvalinii TaxID=2815329 RepID=A0ABS3HX23_9ENTE|nr:GHKL domain-containing protein [Enterococcus sp. MSG2901]MBO0481023.1 GHKL domain-containing protein [Enterococcus sp. MSG2901]
MEKELIYSGAVILLNYLYMMLFFDKRVLTLRYFFNYLVAFLGAGALFFLLRIPVAFLGFYFIVLNLCLSLFLMHNFLISTLFTSFSYSIYHIVWYLTFYRYYQLSGLNLAYPFLAIDTRHFYLLLGAVLLIHLILMWGIDSLVKKYRLTSVLQQYKIPRKSYILFVFFFLFLFVIGALLFLLWQTEYYEVILLLLLVSHVVVLLFVSLTIFFITKNQLHQDLLAKQVQQTEHLAAENYQVQLFRHDYKNILMTIEIFLEQDDLAGLKKYFYQNLKGSTPKLSLTAHSPDLQNLQLLPLRGLLEQKLHLAQTQNIPVEVTVLNPIREVPVPLIDLVRCLGILLDNALDESRKLPEPKIILRFAENQAGISFSVANKAVDPQTIQLAKLTQKGYSTKGDDRGKGLYSLNKLVDSWEIAFFDIYLEDDYIYCDLTIGKE